ncbi:primosomal protein N' [uncultured Desulfuromonas sp.]|uniref:primosomal protein N' n=1 Tax=uncultured Desulfuromonas sp. TaxID=181013 RepID=UPI002AABE84C|nr:primosomal protein N' [uncultured Desulfuromonas sp.]
MENCYAEVAVLAPLPRTLSYRLPDKDGERVAPGIRVKVPLGRRSAVGVVVELKTFAVEDEAAQRERLKPIDAVLDDMPLLPERLLKFIDRASRYYVHPLGLALKTALPAGLSSLQGAPKIRQTRVYRATDTTANLRGSLQQQILSFIVEHQPVELAQLRDQFASPYPVLKRLEELGVICSDEQESLRDPFVGCQVIADHPPELNDAQLSAVRLISASLNDASFRPFLLHGITGSGKTEVYLHSIAAVLAADKQALVLVPEIALTPQLVARFRARFEQQGQRIGVLHSGLSAAERYDMWRAIVRDEVAIVIGARSAVFAPLTRLGMIVVDEEHDDSYKQGEGFRYQGRDMALLRGQMEQVPVVLGSATPSLTSYQRMQQGALTEVSLPTRIGDRTLPEVRLIDMREAEVEHGLSQELIEALQLRLERGEQSLLLLNRRGFSPYLLCRDCGASFRCPNCDITLTWHRQAGTLRCHYCDYVEQPQEQCPHCGGAAIEPEGMGTERLADELQERFPEARVARMDRDSTAAKGAQQKLVSRMEAGEVDILVGTQMIAKGHDFGAVTLVGILDADAALNFPDFRAAERSFCLLAQVAGRAGRGEVCGEVLVQTYAPDSPVLECAVTHDYRHFVALELPMRQLLLYPPFGYLVNLVVSGLDRPVVEGCAQRLAERLMSAQDMEVLGPAPCPLFRLRNRYRMQILLKAPTRSALRRVLNESSQWRSIFPATTSLAIDVDPADMM